MTKGYKSPEFVESHDRLRHKRKRLVQVLLINPQPEEHEVGCDAILSQGYLHASEYNESSGN